MKPGMFIKSTGQLAGTVFEGAVIFIIHADDHGATGFVINKLFHRAFNELAEFSNYPAYAMYEGGPVNPGHLYFLHRRAELITDGSKVNEAIYFGGDFTNAINLLRDGVIASADVKIFVGYCGWDAHDLENEIADGSWEILAGGDPFVIQ